MISWIAQVFRENIAYFKVTNRVALTDLKRQHNASDLGLFWAVAKPFLYLLMFYAAITVGFRSGKDIEGTYCPYFIWLAAGIVQWQFISDLLVWGAGCYQRHMNIIKNTKYPLTTVPMMPVMSRFYIYIIMVGILIIATVCMGVRPSVYWLQLPLYIVLTVIFCYVWVMMTSLMNIISADILEFIKTIRTAFFWLSGILFNIHGSKNVFFLLNPISYLAEGSRNCFAYHVWIWELPKQFGFFVGVMLLMMIVTCLLYKRLEKRIPELI